jgi:oligosaccharyl transferase complex subunit OST4
MISDSQLYTLSIFLGSCAMILIALYHFLEVNALDDEHLSSELTDEKSGVGAVKPVFVSAQANVLSSSPAAGRERGGSVKT